MKKVMFVLSLVLVAAFVLASCAPTAPVEDEVKAQLEAQQEALQAQLEDAQKALEDAQKAGGEDVAALEDALASAQGDLEDAKAEVEKAVAEAAAEAAEMAAEEEQIVLKFANWGGTEEFTAALFQEFIDGFEAEHPNVTIESIAIPYPDYIPQLTTQIAAGQAPDVMQSYVLYSPPIQGMGGLAPLDDYFTQEELDDIMEWKSGIYPDGQLYAISWSPGVAVMHYNKEVLDEAGCGDVNEMAEEWDLFVDCLDKVAALGEDMYGEIIMGDKDPTNYFWDFYFMNGWGCEIWDEEDNVVINSPECVEWAEWMKEAYDKRWISQGVGASEVRNIFANGHGGFFLDGPWGPGVATVLSGRDFSEWGGVMPWPRFQNGERLIPTSTHQLMMSSQSEHPEMAAEFIKYLLSEDIQLAYFDGTGMMPISVSIWDTNESLQGPDQQQVLINSSAEFVKNPPMGATWMVASDFIMSGIQEIWDGEDIQDTLDRVKANVETVGR
jgi:ABC-type glycerol-3-phosphate transport system substrate-binding protein